MPKPCLLYTSGAAQAVEGAGEDLARTGGEDAEILPDVTESQKAVLDKIINALETRDLETAAQVMLFLLLFP